MLKQHFYTTDKLGALPGAQPTVPKENCTISMALLITLYYCVLMSSKTDRQSA